MKICKKCQQRFFTKSEDEQFCCKDCERMYYESQAKQNARAGKGKRRNQFSNEWREIIKIMKENNCQYAKAVEIYERRNGK